MKFEVLFSLMFQTFQLTSSSGSVDAHFSAVDGEVKEFNDDVASQYSDPDGETQKFTDPDQHQKMVMLHSLTSETLEWLESLKSQTPLLHVVYFGALQPDQRQELEDILGDPMFLVQKSVARSWTRI